MTPRKQIGICIILMLSILPIDACKKNSTPAKTVKPFGIEALRDSCVGSYIGTQYNSNWGNGSISYDTVYNVALTITAGTDTTLLVAGGDTFTFQGTITPKNYIYRWLPSSTYFYKSMGVDSTLHKISYSSTMDQGVGGYSSVIVCTR